MGDLEFLIRCEAVTKNDKLDAVAKDIGFQCQQLAVHEIPDGHVLCRTCYVRYRKADPSDKVLLKAWPFGFEEQLKLETQSLPEH